MATTFTQWNAFSKALHKWIRQSLERIASEEKVEGFDESICAALIEQLEVAREDDVAHFKPLKKRKRKDPNAPKGARNAYIFFSSCPKILEELQGEHPNISRKDLTKFIGERWKGMSAEEKQPYVDQAANDKARYQREQKEFSETGSYTESCDSTKEEPKKEEKKDSKKTEKKPAKKAPASRKKKTTKK